ASSVLVDYVPGNFSGPGVIHRDYKVYRGHLFAVCDEGASTLQVMDLHYLPDSVHVVYDSGALLVTAHNIQVDTVNARMYTCGGSTQFSVYDISDPTQPALLSDLEADVPWWNSSVGYVHDCFVRDNIVWTNDADAMHVIDFTDAHNPAILGSLTSYPNQGYNHSSWMNAEGTVLAMADETHGSPLKFIDATDLSDLHIISTVTSGVDPTSILHNPFFTGDMVHVAYYYDGYWLWNVADPAQPILLGYYDTCLEPNTDGYRGAWGNYPFLPSGHVLVSDMQTGLWVLDIDQAMQVEKPSTPIARVWPTITDGSVSLQCFGTEKARVVVMDAAGRIVHSESMNSTSTSFDLGEMSDGLYLVRVSSNGATHTQRIVKSSR
ncbi:MAG TPA: choice-of-anchor B family protein, partial [Flavobacteriales bacterium]|nr:choice-of-anchor B family protein [Flavobacteriales bacterium]